MHSDWIVGQYRYWEAEHFLGTAFAARILTFLCGTLAILWRLPNIRYWRSHHRYNWISYKFQTKARSLKCLGCKLLGEDSKRKQNRKKNMDQWFPFVSEAEEGVVIQWVELLSPPLGFTHPHAPLLRRLATIQLALSFNTVYCIVAGSSLKKSNNRFHLRCCHRHFLFWGNLDTVLTMAEPEVGTI